ncbi:MAG TPA: hypothetical protein VL551_10265 [Actinospica sp.]|jgi:hypothetical protein|nr:hypothetical protein [Actinospica sp.]
MPDFAALFPVADGEQGGALVWRPTPRTADLLYLSLVVAADMGFDELAGHDVGEVVDRDGLWNFFDRLPPSTWTQDGIWRRQFARACDDLAGDLADGRLPVPRCLAEEAALLLAIEDAQGRLEERGFLQISGHEALVRAEGDYDWDECARALGMSEHFPLLDDPRFDGIDDPMSDENERLGLGDLRPARWFEPYENAEPRDRERGFRR